MTLLICATAGVGRGLVEIVPLQTFSYLCTIIKHAPKLHSCEASLPEELEMARNFHWSIFRKKGIKTRFPTSPKDF